MATVEEYKEAVHHKHANDVNEPFLQTNPDRYCMFPVHYDSCWRGFKKLETHVWTAEDINLARDPADFKQLSEEERQSVRNALVYLLTSHSLLLENLALRFLVDVEQPEARAFYSFQAFKQNIHAESYGLILQALVPDEEEQSALFRAMRASPVVQRKVQWAQKWVLGDNSFAERIVAAAALESIFNCSSFLSFFSLKKRDLLPGMTHANDRISKDEGIQVEFGGIIYSELQNKLDQERLREILSEAVEIEKEFAGEGGPAGEGGLNVAALGLKPEDMDQYIEFVADQLAAGLGHERLYKAPNPFPWLEEIALKESSNFASLQAQANTSAATVLKQVGNRSYTLNFDEDF